VRYAEEWMTAAKARLFGDEAALAAVLRAAEALACKKIGRRAGHPLSGERALILGYFVRRLLGVSSADSGRPFAMLQDHVTRLENTVRRRWQAGDVVIWDNRATQHKAVDDYATNRASCAA